MYGEKWVNLHKEKAQGNTTISDVWSHARDSVTRFSTPVFFIKQFPCDAKAVSNMASHSPRHLRSSTVGNTEAISMRPTKRFQRST
jgi:hypothetical protein